MAGRGERPARGPGAGSIATLALGILAALILTGVHTVLSRNAAVDTVADRLTRDAVSAVASTSRSPAALHGLAPALVEDLRGPDRHVAVVAPEGATVATGAPRLGSAPPPEATALDPELVARAVAAQNAVRVERDGWLTVLHPIPGSSGPVGAIALTTALAPPDLPAAGLVFLAVALPVVLLVALAVWAIGGRSRRPPRRSALPGAPPVAVAPPPRSDHRSPEPPLVAERERLIRAAIEVRDEIRSLSLGLVLDDALAAAGVERVQPDGERFDPHHHRAVDQAATNDPALAGTIALTERPGYRDRGRLLRLPDVVVYELEGERR